MTDAQNPSVAQPQQENQQLRAELQKRQIAEKKATERRMRVIKTTGSLLLPLMDRKRVFRTFMQFSETMGRFGGNRAEWPTTDEILVDAKLFALSCLRFAIRRWSTLKRRAEVP